VHVNEVEVKVEVKVEVTSADHPPCNVPLLLLLVLLVLLLLLVRCLVTAQRLIKFIALPVCSAVIHTYAKHAHSSQHSCEFVLYTVIEILQEYIRYPL
jgi:hypothetical protein